MGFNTKIAWAHHSWNPWIGCTKVSEECRNCYAESMAKRYGWARWGAGQTRVKTSDANWRKPLMWDRQAAALRTRYRVFCASLADIGDADVPREWLGSLFELIAATPNLDWLLLTKRPENLMGWLPWSGGDAPWDNVWLGTSVGVRASLWRIDALRALPAAVRFLSCEPLLQVLTPVDLSLIHWVIAGGESGRGVRPMPFTAYNSLLRECREQNVPFFLKQTGTILAKQLKLKDRAGADFDELPPVFRVREFPKNYAANPTA